MAFEVTQDRVTGISRYAFTYYDRLNETEISNALIKIMREEIQKAVTGDAALRERIKEAITVASASLPLEAIVKAVKDAVHE